MFTSKQRTGPIRLDADLRRESIEIAIPDGFKLDELPQPARIESPYGALQASWVLENGKLVMQETFEIRESMVPASEYAQVRDFFELVAGAHNAAVVLVRQTGQP